MVRRNTLAGAQANQIAVAPNADGRLEAFYVGTNNDLYHVAQTAANNSLAWTASSVCPARAPIR